MLSRIVPYLPYYPYLLAGLFGLSLLLLLIAAFNLWRQRSAKVWRRRHDAGKRGSRLLLVSLSMLIGTTFVSIFSGVIIFSLGYQNEFFPPRNPYGVAGVAITALPTISPTASPAPVVTRTSGRGSTSQPPPGSTAAAAPRPTATPRPPTAVPTATISPLASLGISLPIARTMPDANASLTITAADGQVATDGSAPSPQDRFPAGVQRLYVFVEYQHMTDGVAWARILYHEGKPVQGGASLWASGENGHMHFMFEERRGYPPGDYEVKLFLSNREVQNHRLTIN